MYNNKDPSHWRIPKVKALLSFCFFVGLSIAFINIFATLYATTTRENNANGNNDANELIQPLPVLGLLERTNTKTIVEKGHIDEALHLDTNLDDSLQQYSFENTTIWTRQQHNCQHPRNAIVYLARKDSLSKNTQNGLVHANNGGHVSSNLIKSLGLLQRNYLSLQENWKNVDVFIFHTGDFAVDDYKIIEDQLHSEQNSNGVVNKTPRLFFVDISQSIYWKLPRSVQKDNPTTMWYQHPKFSTGYRLMTQWYSVGIWRFFDAMNNANVVKQVGNDKSNNHYSSVSCYSCKCKYQYIWRMDEDSYIHSSIDYNIFDLMQRHDYVYGFRMCSYEMARSQRMYKVWKQFMQKQLQQPNATVWKPQRELDHEMCGFYNNFFVAKLDFFLEPNVDRFLRMIENKGHLFRKLLGDLVVHSMAVYMFADNAHQVYRFLDFTYEHSSFDYAASIDGKSSPGCLFWGGIQAGYRDVNASATIEQYYQEYVVKRNCHTNRNYNITRQLLPSSDLSPTYAHLDLHYHSDGNQRRKNLMLETLVAGAVELSDKGKLSG